MNNKSLNVDRTSRIAFFAPLIFALACAILSTSCISWLGDHQEALQESELRPARGEQTLTISFRYKNLDYSQMTEQSIREYKPQLLRWMQPGMDRLTRRGIFEKVEFVGLDRVDTGRHLDIQQEEDSGAWTITNAILAGLTLNWIPTYVRPDHVFYVSYYENGQERKTYNYRFTFHSINWNLFLPVWLIYSNQDTNDNLYATLFEYIARDLIKDEVI